VVKVLFVDDEPMVLTGLRRIFWEYSDIIDASFAGSGQEAIEMMKANPAEVVVTDISMPGMTGDALIAELYKNFPKVLPIVLSGHWTPVVSSHKLGPSVKLLAKPVQAKMLLEAILEAASLTKLVPESPSASSFGLFNAETAQHTDLADTWVMMTEHQNHRSEA